MAGGALRDDCSITDVAYRTFPVHINSVEEGMTLSPAQCRAARALLAWSHEELDLVGGIVLGVDVRDLLQLQGTFKCQRIGGATAEIKQVSGERNLSGGLLNAFIML